MDILIAAMILTMAIVALELTTDGGWRSGHWRPHLPTVPLTGPTWMRRHVRPRRSGHHVIRIVRPHPPAHG